MIQCREWRVGGDKPWSPIVECTLPEGHEGNHQFAISKTRFMQITPQTLTEKLLMDILAELKVLNAKSDH